MGVQITRDLARAFHDPFGNLNDLDWCCASLPGLLGIILVIAILYRGPEVGCSRASRKKIDAMVQKSSVRNATVMDVYPSSVYTFSAMFEITPSTTIL